MISTQPKEDKDMNRFLSWIKVKDSNNILPIGCHVAGHFSYTWVILVPFLICYLFSLCLWHLTSFSLITASLLHTLSFHQLCLHLSRAASLSPHPQPVLGAVRRLIPVTRPPKVIWPTFLSAALWDIWALRPVFWKAICTPSSYLCWLLRGQPLSTLFFFFLLSLLLTE